MEGFTDTCTWKSIDVLLVTALREEKEAVLKLLEEFRPIQQVGASNIYHVCTIQAENGEHRVAVIQLNQMGNVEAGIRATQAISELDPAYVLMVGIAAGTKGRVRLGDVIVSTQVFYYEQAKLRSQGAEIRPSVIPVDPYLLQSSQNLQGDDWRKLVVVDDAQREAFDPPEVRFGPLAVGDKVVADEDYASDLMQFHPKLIGIEMESYGVAAAAANALSRPRFLAIRGVSDFADEQKDDCYRRRASAVAAAFAVGFLRYGYLQNGIARSSATEVLSNRPSSFIAIRHISKQVVPFRTIVESLQFQFVRPSVTELLVNQTDLYVDGCLSDPLEAVKRQTDLDYRVDDLLGSHADASLGYFGIAHIPLLFHSGYRLTNKRRLHFFELNRYTGIWEYVQGEGDYSELRVDGLSNEVNVRRGDVLIRISISNTVRQEEVSDVVPAPIASVHLHIEPPARDNLASTRQLYNYGGQFRRVLDTVHELLPNRVRTHIFYAGPVSLALYFGQLIIQTIDRRIIVYNYTEKDSPRYSWGLEITAEESSSDFLVQTN